MIFNSLDFLIFFVIIIFLFFSLPHKYRKILLLIASYFFYGYWNPAYLILIFVSTAADFYVAKSIYNTKNLKKRKILLTISIVINIGILFTFKYLNFLAQTLNIVHQGDKLINVLLPVGISFYTFQTISYSIDVYRRKIRSEDNIIDFSLFVVFFPQLVSGPIERASKFLPQLKQKVTFDPKRITLGLLLMLYGFFLKVVVADNLSVFVEEVFDKPQAYQGINVAIAVFFFSFQIYSDFFGYTNIARGIALIIGIELSVNFKQPFFASSIKDFWRRWHISLSTWFKDYVYISLGGKKNNTLRWILAIIITYGLSGIWHGANWTFLIWGLLNALIYLIEKFFSKKTSTSTSTQHSIVKKLSKIIITFSIINFLWFFFRANSITDSLLLIKNFFTPDFKITFNHKLIIMNLCFILIVVVADFLSRKKELHIRLSETSLIVRLSVVYVLIFMILLLGNWHQKTFIYFQF